MEGERSSKTGDAKQPSSDAGTRTPESAEREGEPQPRVVTEFEVRERDVALRIRVERWPSSSDADDDTLMEAGYGHGV